MGNDAQVGDGDCRKDRDYGPGEVCTNARFLHQERDTGDDEQNRHEREVVIGAYECHVPTSRYRKRVSLEGFSPA